MAKTLTKTKKKRPAPKLELFKKLLLSTINKGIWITPTETAMRVYDCKDRLVARCIASQNLSKLNITFEMLMDRMGLTDEEDLSDLARLRKAKRIQSCDVYISDENGKMQVNENSNDFIEVDDNPTQLKALELTMRLKKRLDNRHDFQGSSTQTNMVIIVEKEKDEHGTSQSNISPNSPAESSVQIIDCD